MTLSQLKKNLISIVGLLLCISIVITEPTTSANNNQTSDLNLSLINSFPIFINSNEDFIALNFTGEGTINNPYLIENLNIVSTSELTSAIRISGTDVYFIIQNCVITSKYIGIAILETVEAGTAKIINNTITCSSKNGGGISISSSNTILENNTISGFMQGIHVNEADYTTIKGNIIHLSYYQGINIRYSGFNTITDNDIRDSNQHGLALVGSSSMYNIIYGNIFVNNSNEPTYEIDGGVVIGDTSSQGYDGASNNQWYDSVHQKGNSWDDYDGEGTYSIDGSAGSEDLYPERYITQTAGNNSITIVTLITIIGLTALTIRRRK